MTHSNAVQLSSQINVGTVRILSTLVQYGAKDVYQLTGNLYGSPKDLQSWDALWDETYQACGAFLREAGYEHICRGVLVDALLERHRIKDGARRTA